MAQPGKGGLVGPGQALFEDADHQRRRTILGELQAPARGASGEPRGIRPRTRRTDRPRDRRRPGCARVVIAAPVGAATARAPHGLWDEFAPAGAASPQSCQGVICFDRSAMAEEPDQRGLEILPGGGLALFPARLRVPLRAGPGRRRRDLPRLAPILRGRPRGQAPAATPSPAIAISPASRFNGRSPCALKLVDGLDGAGAVREVVTVETSTPAWIIS